MQSEMIIILMADCLLNNNKMKKKIQRLIETKK